MIVKIPNHEGLWRFIRNGRVQYDQTVILYVSVYSVSCYSVSVYSVSGYSVSVFHPTNFPWEPQLD